MKIKKRSNKEMQQIINKFGEEIAWSISFMKVFCLFLIGIKQPTKLARDHLKEMVHSSFPKS